MPTDFDYHDILLNFSSIIFEALPFVVLGVVIAGLLEEFVPQQLLGRIFQGDSAERSRLPRFLRPVAGLLRFRLLAIAVGGLLGLVFPMCECGIIAVMRRLIRKGVPLSVCICYILAGPIINVVTLLSTYVAFNVTRPTDSLFPIAESNPLYDWLHGARMMVALRAGLGFVVAFVTSVVVEWQYRKHGDQLLDPSLIVQLRQEEKEESGYAATHKRRLSQRLANISETTLHDFVDIMAFLILGAALAALGRQWIDKSELETWVQQSPALAILGMMALAVVFCICSEADAFIAANFGAAMPPAAKVAFVVFGPMVDVKLYLMYTRIFRQRLIWTIIFSVALQVFVYCMLLHFLWPQNGYSLDYMSRSMKRTQ
jgi:uncharacterized membrane protein YraQ (UPF0718 family)